MPYVDTVYAVLEFALGESLDTLGSRHPRAIESIPQNMRSQPRLLFVINYICPDACGPKRCC